MKQLARSWRVGEERCGRGELSVAAERLGEGFEDVGPPRRVIDARSLGDALDERRYADLVSNPACS